MKSTNHRMRVVDGPLGFSASSAGHLRYDGATIAVDPLLAEAWRVLNGTVADLRLLSDLGALGVRDVAEADFGYAVTVARAVDRVEAGRSLMEDTSLGEVIARRAGELMGGLLELEERRPDLAERFAPLRRWIEAFTGLWTGHPVADSIRAIAEEVRHGGARTRAQETRGFDELVERARRIVEGRHPHAAPERQAAFLNCVTHAVTGVCVGYGGPSVREHAADHMIAGRRLSFEQAVEILAAGEGPIFGPLGPLHKRIWLAGNCFDDDPADRAALMSSARKRTGRAPRRTVRERG